MSIQKIKAVALEVWGYSIDHNTDDVELKQNERGKFRVSIKGFGCLKGLVNGQTTDSQDEIDSTLARISARKDSSGGILEANHSQFKNKSAIDVMAELSNRLT